MSVLGRWLAALLLLAAALSAGPLLRRWRAVQLLEHLSAQSGEPQTPSSDFTERELLIPSAQGPIRARLYYSPASNAGSGLVVAHGVHYRGIDERRLVPFARELAAAGPVVLTPELDDLIDYRITRRGLDVITDSALWLGKRTDLVASPQVGLLGL